MKLFFCLGAVLGLIIGLAGQAIAVTQTGDTQITRHAVPGEFIVSLRYGEEIADVNNLVTQFAHLLAAKPEVVLFGNSGRLVWIKVRPEITAQELAKQFSKDQLNWLQPNYEYLGDPREFTTSDPQLGEQFHHEVMANREAWDVAIGDRQIVVAVTDDGVELNHEDLVENLWVNPGEIPNNGIDDDGNGYIDDVNGYDIIAGDSDPNPESGDYHGTHVAGIVAATANNGLGIAGTAPGVAVMAVKFYGGGSWTSRVIAESYRYATDNGANIITTSYNINSFVGDLVFEEGVQYGYDRGVLHFNSAGNGYQQNPARQYFDQLILTCSTIADNETNDVKSNYSNYGYGVDLCAPGGGGNAGILSTYKGNTYRRLSGTSMASPNAAAVAALIWSYNPNWTRDQVAARLFASGENIDGLNSEYAGELGAGRVNSARALTVPNEAPTLVGLANVVNGRLEGAANILKVDTNMVFDPATMNTLGAFSVVAAGEDGEFGTADDRKTPYRIDRPYKVGTQHFVLTLAANLPRGTYLFRARADVLADPFGQALDGNGDGIGGDDFSLEFTVP